jgi:CRISPR-associated protein Csm2
MQYNPQHKQANQSRPGNKGKRSEENENQSGWNEEKALAEIKQSFGDNWASELLSKQKSDYNDYIRKVKAYAEGTAKEITTTQLRNIFSRIIKIKISNLDDLHVLRPKLAYVAGRSDKKMKTLVFLLDILITKIDDDPVKLCQFQAFFEAIVAYHKYYEPEKGSK